ncbi:MAG TPA: CoA ester lyase [Casimicrobiaceae bacterium]
MPLVHGLAALMEARVPDLPHTYLFVPGDRPDRFDKALASGAHAVIVDLEDAVAPDAKANARIAFASWHGANPALRERVLLRINDSGSRWFDEDLELVRKTRVACVVLPKTETVTQIDRLTSVLVDDGLVIPLIESASGVALVDAIACAARVQRMAFGTLDYALDVDIPGDERGLLYPACRIAVASRAAGIASPIAGVTPEIGDEAKLRADLAFARSCGFGAKLCIHPRQVAAVHAAMRPSEEEIAWARRVVAASESAPGAIQVDGKMVDRPVIARARRILAATEHNR